MGLKQLLSDLTAFSQSPRAERWLKAAGPVFLIAIGTLLACQLTRIGWQEMSRSLPSTPWFYLLFPLFYLVLPASEACIYARLWRCSFWRLLPRACMKHVCNQDVLELSGEVYFYVWSTRRLGLNPGQTLRTIKDITILSAVVGYVVTLAFPTICLWLGVLGPGQGLTERQSLVIGWGAPLLLCGVVAVTAAARRVIFFLPGRALLAISGVHLVRLALTNAILVAQWAIVVPGQPWSAWLTLLAVSNLVGRLPSVLSNNLVFVAAGIQLAGSLGLPPAAVAGMLLANTALDKLTNLSIVLGTTLASRFRPAGDQPVAEVGGLPPDVDIRQVA